MMDNEYEDYDDWSDEDKQDFINACYSGENGLSPDDCADLEDDLSFRQCPYFKQDGSMGKYGPNTCMGGCVDEPRCVT